MKLRPSQIKVLVEIDALGGKAPAGEMAARLETTCNLAEARLRRLEDRGLLNGSYSDGPSWNRKYIYRLTYKGRAELEGKGS